jgi:hypothetical protein
MGQSVTWHCKGKKPETEASVLSTSPISTLMQKRILALRALFSLHVRHNLLDTPTVPDGFSSLHRRDECSISDKKSIILWYRLLRRFEFR